jgi:hypothetical protein
MGFQAGGQSEEFDFDGLLLRKESQFGDGLDHWQPPVHHV